MRGSSRIALAALFAFVPVLCAYAHPHVFISNHVSVDFEGTVLERVSVEWTFDELFSQMVIADYDKGSKGSFTEAEAMALKKGAFDNLRNYHYFLAFFLNGKALTLPPIRDFKPTIKDGRLIYSFSLPLELPIAAKSTELRITVYDDTYYVAFDKTNQSDVEVRTADAVAAEVSMEKTMVKPEWPGQFMPDQIVLRMRRK